MSPSSLGRLIAQQRRLRGYSQARLAELLCAAADSPTVTRHEVSRWERGDRLPGAQWLGWLAHVLDLSPARLGLAAAPELRRISTAEVADLCLLAGRWLRQDPVRGPGPAAPDPGIGELRRMDDLVGGADLAPVAARRRRQAVAALRPAQGADRARLLLPAVELSQLAGWTAADAGQPRAALATYREGLVLAMEAGDRQLGAHLLGSASHLLGEREPGPAWQLARTAAAGVRVHGSPGLRALLAHRAAYAAARCGDPRAAHGCLLVAQRLGERLVPEREPPWLYWLDQSELAAMTGRCLVALDRPLRALALLGRPELRGGRQPRSLAVYSGWLARALLGVGELEEACAVGADGVVASVRSGSVRAAEQTRELAARLAPRQDVRAARELSDLIRYVTSYLPGEQGLRRLV
ncbi:helix-turn-helix transcriptional regulator [Catellatospora sp. KI3]|uniref:helix-turn-helix transcriptional regulator n=1 Tax=Catellatospora sp. KI3 TaxID=3041620 RepID=UPI0024830AF5|nr:helix-turn-helix transcriptional regulator [Catellatospora sp. KI3]MDI1464900.1 helix-turn-helix transcriptional regulator [Catellatospora sp. KI3]